MARTYLSTTGNYTVTDYNDTAWIKAELSITVDSAGSGTYTIKMTNNLGSGYRCTGSLVFSINGTMIHDKFYDSTTALGVTFPTKHGSSKTGSFTVSSNTDSFLVGLAVCRSQAAVTYDTDANRNRLVNGTATRVGTEKPSGGAAWQAYHAYFHRKYYDHIQGGTVSITDNFDNTFTISATAGQDGQGNPYSNIARDPVIKYGYSKDTRTSSCSNGASKTLTPSGTGGTRKVYAQATYTGSLGGSDTKYAEKDIRQYLSPVWTDDTDGSSLTITVHQNAAKTRLTLKDNWLLDWEDCTSCGYSQLEGYRIRIYVNDQSYRLWRLNGDLLNSDDELTKLQDNWNIDAANRRNRYLYDRKNTQSALAINPNHLIGPNGEKVKPGDVITFGIYPFTHDGKDNVLWGAERLSAEYVVQNAGIVHVKVGSEWKEGQVWVKVGSVWKEAETVNIRAATQWKESQ